MYGKAKKQKVGGNTTPSFQHRAWCFTNHKMDTKWDEKTMKYLVYQKEEGKDTKRMHHQGYVVFDTKRTLSGAQKLLSDEKIHMEPRRGSHEQAKRYCTKQETRIEGPWEFGKEDTQGARTDIKEFVQDIKKGMTEWDVAETHTESWAKYPKLYDRVRNLMMKNKKREKPHVTVFWGEPGTGKTRKAVEMASKMGPYFILEGEMKWWDGYEGEETIIIDDLQKSDMKRSLIVSLLDRYKARREIKGGHTYVCPKTIFITCNKTDWIDEAIRRRIDVMKEMKKNEYNERKE